MSAKFFAVVLFLHGAVLTPIHYYYAELPLPFPKRKHHKGYGDDYLWSYTVFTYAFSILMAALIVLETREIVKVRQAYLGSRHSITDRTFQLTRIPRALRSEDTIKERIEELGIGSVQEVKLCRDWERLDCLADKRIPRLTKLEEAWSNKRMPDGFRRLFSRLNPSTSDSSAPIIKVRYGFLGMRTKKMDATIYQEEELRRLDEEILAARKREYRPVSMAFVTMTTVSACQLAVRALIYPTPERFRAVSATTPSDVVWANTYKPRWLRRLLSWSILMLLFATTIIWLAPVAALASLLNVCFLEARFPQISGYLQDHAYMRAIIQTGLPALIVSALNASIPLLYAWLSSLRGFRSKSSQERSAITQNFVFLFFNVFLVFTIFGAVTNIASVIRHAARDTTELARALANSLDRLGIFYTNFVLLQALGLAPLRLLQLGTLIAYRIAKGNAKTARDFVELVRPAQFDFGLYLPSAMLVFIICLTYSILPAGFMVLLFGLAYFVLNYYTYKYQLLFSMDRPKHATCRLWLLIINRLIMGLGVFQLAMFGVLLTRNMRVASLLILPLIPYTIWLGRHFNQTFGLALTHVALSSITTPVSHDGDESHQEEADFEYGYTNPNTVAPLDLPEPQGAFSEVV